MRIIQKVSEFSHEKEKESSRELSNGRPTEGILSMIVTFRTV
jgi:hypothetical protein